MSFEFDTYIVLDMPSPVNEIITNLRKHHNDEFRSSLPVEITVAGSSGNGVIEKGQDEEFVYNTIKQIALRTKPIKTSFKDVLRFPGTDIFVLTLRDEDAFMKLYEKINKSGIKFKHSEFPYKPHCTLRSKSPISDDEIKAIMETKIDLEFILDTISIYTMDKIPMSKIFTNKLLG